MTADATAERRATRQVVAPDLPRFDVAEVDPALRAALGELLLTMADDEFVLGFWDSEWTGIAPMLEEDVAFSSLAQDELGHARVLYELLAQLTGGDADAIAFDREADGYRHAALLDHPRTDWAFSVVRRWLYDTADAVRLTALRESSFAPLREVVAKIRREERYHLMHLDAWLRRLASAPGEPRARLEDALARLAPEGAGVFAPLEHEAMLLEGGVLARPMQELASDWADGAQVTLRELGLSIRVPAEPTSRPTTRSEAFHWLWGEFTMVRRSDEGATW